MHVYGCGCMMAGWDARGRFEPGSVGPWVEVGLQAVERSPLDPTTHACPLMRLLSLPSRHPCAYPCRFPAPALSAYVIRPSVWAGSVVIEGRAWGAAPATNQGAAFDSAASANAQGKPDWRYWFPAATRRHDDTSRSTLTRRKNTLPRGPLVADSFANQLPACSPLSQSQSQSQPRCHLLRLREDDSWGGGGRLFSASHLDAASAGHSGCPHLHFFASFGLLGTPSARKLSH